MSGAARRNELLSSSLKAMLFASAIAIAGCTSASDLWDRLPDTPKEGRTKVDDSGFPVFETPTKKDLAIVSELEALRNELKKRSGRLEGNLAALKAELVRRQAAGEISADKVKLTPAQIRDEQVSQLDALKAELERRRTAKDVKQRIVTTALTENEVAYSSIDQCLSSGSDFRQAFRNRGDLSILVQEKDNQVYRNEDRTLLILTSKDTCDVSFAGGSLNDYAAGLAHVLETQGGVVESKTVAGLNVLSVAHPRGNFRLASGRKVIGGGGNTNLYTTISVAN